jgi:hypothetical protein
MEGGWNWNNNNNTGNEGNWVNNNNEEEEGPTAMELCLPPHEEMRLAARAVAAARAELRRNRARVTAEYHNLEVRLTPHLTNLWANYVTNKSLSPALRRAAFGECTRLAQVYREISNMRVYLAKLFEVIGEECEGHNHMVELTGNVAAAFPLQNEVLSRVTNIEAFESVITLMEALLCGLPAFREALALARAPR